MSKSILFNCTIKIEEAWFHITLDKSFFESADYSVSLHNHADYEVHIIENGEYAFQIDGRDHVLRTGNCLVIGPNVYHSKGNALTPGSRRHCFKFDCSVNAGKNPELLECMKRISGIFLLDNAPGEILLVHALLTEFETRQTGYRTYINSLFTQLLLTLLRDISGHAVSMVQEQLGSTEENRSAAIDEFFAKRCLANARADELAEILCLSVRQLNRVMLKSYGVPFKQKLLQMKIIAAKDLLSDTNFTVHKIAEITGYNNTGYFISTFKKLTGTTPERYRKTQCRKSSREL